MQEKRLSKEKKGFRFVGYKQESGMFSIKDLKFDTGVDTNDNLRITIQLSGWIQLDEIPQVLRDLGWMCAQFAENIVEQLTAEIEKLESAFLR